MFFEFRERLGPPIVPGVAARLELTQVPATNASQVVSLEFTEEATQAYGLGEGKYIINGINGFFSNGCNYNSFFTSFCSPGQRSSALSVSPEGLLTVGPGEGDFVIISGTAPSIPGFGNLQLYMDISSDGIIDLSIFQRSVARPTFPGEALPFSLSGNFTLVTEPSSAGDFDGDGESKRRRR